MADAPKDAPEAGRILIQNIGLLLTGDLDQPIADSDCLLIEDGVIIGLEQGDADRVIDAGGCAVAPGLIDGHCCDRLSGSQTHIAQRGIIGPIKRHTCCYCGHLIWCRAPSYHWHYV